MKKLKSILVPVDGSPCAENACHYAMGLAQKHGAEVVLLHVNDNGNKDEGSRYFGSLEAKLAHAGNIRYRHVTTDGAITESITDQAEKEGSGMIVMGTEGDREPGSAIFGSLASSVLAHSSCPVLIVPSSCSFHLPKRITFAMDHHVSDSSTLSAIVELFRAPDTQVNVLHIGDPGEDAGEEVKRMEGFMSQSEKHSPYNNMSFQLLNAADKEARLEEFVLEGNTDLLILSSRKRSSWQQLFGHSISARLAERMQVPMLFFHIQETNSVKIF